MIVVKGRPHGTPFAFLAENYALGVGLDAERRSERSAE